MDTRNILKSLTSQEILTDAHAAAIEAHEQQKPFSIYRELRFLLYLGILLFTTGIGILVYQNIDTIGHQIIIAAIVAASAGCFYYVTRHALPYSNSEVANPRKFYSYILLLGCATFLTAEGYLQYQYEVFGTRYGLAVLLPTIIFFFCAYRFDHAGALSMAITGLASWLGLTIAPLAVLSSNDFTQESLLVTAIILGVCLTVFGYVSEKKQIKAHFAFTYFLLGGNLAGLACLVGLFVHDQPMIYFLLGVCLNAFFIFRARHAQSLIFLLMGTVYGYIFISYALFNMVGDSAAFALAIYYFLFSSVGVVYFFLNYKKFLGIKK